MLIDDFLKNYTEFDAIDQYIKNLAQKNLNFEKVNLELSESFKLSNKLLFIEQEKVKELEKKLALLDILKKEMEQRWQSGEKALLERADYLQKQIYNKEKEITTLKYQIEKIKRRSSNSVDVF
jgi:hypothetical protein